jgi:hypothetical protein
MLSAKRRAIGPKGPRGERRPADVIGTAVMVMRIATGEEGEIMALRAVKTKLLKSSPARAGRAPGCLDDSQSPG